MSEKMVLVDGNSLMHRAFHALPMMTSSEGVYTGALFGFLNMFLKMLEDERPAYAAVAFDVHAPTFRHVKYDEYKAGRSPTPEELITQMQAIREILRDMHVRVVECPGYEADDILGTLSQKCEEMGIDACIVTGDRDAFQLSGPHTTIFYTKQGVRELDRITPESIREEWGVEPVRLIDIKGLMGDNSDNIPGVPGVGEKTAKKLIAEHGTLENVLAAAEGIKGKLGERLRDNRDSAVFSKWLATIVRDAPLEIGVADCRLGSMRDAIAALSRLQLNTAIKRIEKYEAELRKNGQDIPAVETETQTDVSEKWERFDNADAFLRALSDMNAPEIGLVWEEDSLSLCAPGVLFGAKMGGDLLDAGLSPEAAVQIANAAVEMAGKVYTYDLKRLLHAGVHMPEGTFDVMLAAYVLQPQRRSYSLQAMAEERNIPWESGAMAAALMSLAKAQEADVRRDELETILYQIELPLAFVLRDMEDWGAYTDRDALAALGAQYERRIGELLDEIHTIAGDDLNPNSPKQLSVYLFETLGLSGGKKTKTGFSTNVETLEAIADQHPVIPLILEYRKYFKLKSTYIDALLRLRDGEGRVHTSFDQVATATGRISSQEPNLQNIPVRTPLGRDIRKAFCAREGWALVDADYSQIELRVLADLSGDERMQKAFREGADIHTATAAEVYDLPMEFISPEMRSSAKAVNFGIVYGISDFGLAKNIQVSRQEAAEFIQRYLERYPGVKRFMDNCVSTGKAQGYVTTPMGRRRYLPELAERNPNMRKFGERAAMNSPIQGAAADLIKLAMIRVWRALKENNMRARLILQVHDELIVEAPMEEREKAEALMKSCMEDVAQMAVPLIAEVKSGSSWYECK